MIRITDKSLCTGCSACVNICPVQCIVLRRDREGFDYPVANPDICISCGKCERICPVLNPLEPSFPLEAFAARSEEYAGGSSSGGVFPVLAEKVIENDGAVFGAVMNPDLTVGHSEAIDMKEVCRMRGSKYVQSDLYSVFEEVKGHLESGKKVLFSGTPCQVAGLNSYLGRDYDGLLTADCACHGVPSPGLWEKYVKALQDRYGSPVRDVCFRDKRGGWRKYEMVVCFEDREVAVWHQKDPYMLLFLQDMSLRPSCYQCRFRNGRSGSDLTLADLWNVAEASPEFDDDKGVSLVLANTNKGLSALKASGVDMRKVDAGLAMKRNGGFAADLIVPERRQDFFRGHHSAKNIIWYMEGFVRHDSFYKRLRGYVSNIIMRKK